MTMRPAPMDNTGTYCSLSCRGSRIYAGEWAWDGRHSASFCPDCGRPIGFDADGNPVVGHSPKHNRRAMEWMANELNQRTDMFAYSISGICKDALAATKETS